MILQVCVDIIIISLPLSFSWELLQRGTSQISVWAVFELITTDEALNWDIEVSNKEGKKVVKRHNKGKKIGKILNESKNISEQTDTTDTVCQKFLAEQKAARVASASGIYVIEINYANTS